MDSIENEKGVPLIIIQDNRHNQNDLDKPCSMVTLLRKVITKLQQRIHIKCLSQYLIHSNYQTSSFQCHHCPAFPNSQTAKRWPRWTEGVFHFLNFTSPLVGLSPSSLETQWCWQGVRYCSVWVAIYQCAQ